MEESILIPGKIFLIGEYHAVQGGKALVAALRPAYEYASTSSGIALHSQSPAAQYLSEKNPASLKARSLIQSKIGLGPGFGTSTAELIAVAAESNRDRLLGWYQKKFPQASGADLAVQLEAMKTGRAVFEINDKKVVKPLSSSARLYQNIFLFQNAPAQKLATHVALAKDFVYLNADLANDMVEKLITAVESDDLSSLSVFTEWAEWLAKLGLETELARNIRVDFASIPGVVGAKGCGAGLHDVFLVAVTDAEKESFLKQAESISQKYDLKFLGALSDHFWSENQNIHTVKVFAPVNIAWIKYMGKEHGQPANASLSMTLDQVGTTTRITVVDTEEQNSEKGNHQKITWSKKSYLPPENGQQKVEKFLFDESFWRSALGDLGFALKFPKQIVIETQNNVPAGTGIATSASAFAALTLAWATLLVGEEKTRFLQKLSHDPSVRKVLASIAQKGSGSACRSFLGPWVEWHPTEGVLAIEAGKIKWIDFILLFEEEAKKVSSSEAHERVKTSPLWSGRVERANHRLNEVKPALKNDELKILQTSVLTEALDMHELFHTAVPSFTYWKPESKSWIERIQNQDSSLPSPNAVITLDAGANVHCFVPETEQKIWRTYLENQKIKFIAAAAGKGAHHVDENI